MTDDLLALLSPAIRKEWGALGVTDLIAQLQRHRLLPIALAHARQANGGLDGLRAGLWDALMAAGRSDAGERSPLLERVRRRSLHAAAAPLAAEGRPWVVGFTARADAPGQ
ncbi:MAG: hypothetical protein IPO66_20690 [Rhodanobacteraceae bacterium]|nr:hypothetical protein [Rhodanobacteraceae bacterium]